MSGAKNEEELRLGIILAMKTVSKLGNQPAWLGSVKVSMAR
jgi:hypothetical protein